VNHSLFVATANPLQHRLLFERFLSERRTSLPDIDLDVESAWRLEVYDRIFERFGRERVAVTGMPETYRARHALRDTGLALGIAPHTVDRIAKSFPHIRAQDIPHALAELPELRQLASEAARFGPLWELAAGLDALPRGYAMHPCGVILSDATLLDRLPVQPTPGGYPMVQADKDDVEELGLLKLDVLGVRMQSAMAHAVAEIRRATGRQLDRDSPDHVDLADPETFERIRRGHVLGCPPIPSGKRIVFATLEDGSSLVDLAFFEDSHDACARTVFHSGLLLVRGTVERRGTRRTVVGEMAWDLDAIATVRRDLGPQAALETLGRTTPASPPPQPTTSGASHGPSRTEPPEPSSTRTQTSNRPERAQPTYAGSATAAPAPQDDRHSQAARPWWSPSTGRGGRVEDMCGRYVSTRRPQDLAGLFQVTRWNPEEIVEPSWNVAPTNAVWAVLERPHEDTGELERQLRPLQWGLVPSWAKSLSIGSKMINARVGTVHEKPAYRRAFAKRRCLLPADGFYEWVRHERCMYAVNLA
ncbi:SOS response-associated peptidase family protein, partial [Streptomyces sp. NPDC054933]